MNVSEIIDRPAISAVQLRIIGICFLLNMLDGMDVLAISFAAPVIAENWSITPQALGIVFSAALVGMAIGAVFISPYTDVIGRKKMILASLVLISLGMLSTAFAESVIQLSVLRLVAGVGIGSMLASLTSMVSEYAPERHRNMAILILHAAYPVGAIISGFIAAWVLPVYGWASLFLLAGAISLLAIPIVYFALPESLEFLLNKQPSGALNKVNRILASMQQEPVLSLPDRHEEGVSRVGLRALFTDEYRQSTSLLWLAFMMSFATLYFLFSWVVKLAFESGLSFENAMYAGISLNLGAFFGSVSLGYLSSKFGLKSTIACFLFMGALMSIAYGNIKVSVFIVLMLIFFLMYFVQGGFTGLYAVAARLYPTEIRTTGIGWAIGAGRIGAILGPAIAGFILGSGVSIGWTFIVFSIPLVVAGYAICRFSHDIIR